MHRQTHSLKAVSQSSVIRYLLSCASDSFQIHKKLFFLLFPLCTKRWGGGMRFCCDLSAIESTDEAAGAFCFRSGVTTFPTDSTSLHRDEKTLFSLVQFTLIHPPPTLIQCNFNHFPTSPFVCSYLKKKFQFFFFLGGFRVRDILF